MVVLSFPGPLPPVDKEALKNRKIFSRNYRNRRIGDFLKELDLTEGRGTGFPIIYRKMEQNGSPEPMFETDDKHTHFLAVLPVHPEFLKEVDTPDTVQVTTQDTVQVTTQVGELLRVLNTAMDRQEIQERLNLANRENFRLNYLKPALDVGLIEMTIPDKPNSRLQKYRLTVLGKQMKKEL